MATVHVGFRLLASLISHLAFGGHSERPKNAVNLTLYHVNPRGYSPEPINMDTGDALGDMFFDLRSVLRPIECADDPSQHDCKNAEVTSPDLVITKIIVEANRDFSQYARCNICVNGTDQHGHNNCTDGTYVCGCGRGNHSVPCAPGVGRENLTEAYGSSTCKSGQANWECWRDAVARKTGGIWFSTLDIGHCDDPQAEACTWRLVQVVKRINKTCSDDVIYSSAEQYDSEQGRNCFEACHGRSPARNTSDPCWIQCFYETVLGPDAGKPGGAIGGMPLSRLVDAWHAPFDSDAPQKGGCPHIFDEQDPVIMESDVLDRLVV